jgi:lycopene cyclase domain-containing protein
MDRYQYLLLLGACLVLTLPLELVLGARVYRRPGRVLRALWLPLVVFMAWDVVAIRRGHWWFAERYVTGIALPGDVPVEELAFFVAVPLCTLLTYDTVGRLLPRRA